jgi:hypothetical protein
MIIDRVARLLAYCHLPALRPGQLFFTSPKATPTHEILDSLDSVLCVDTRHLTTSECNCLWHIGRTCSAVRQVGARVALLEEAVARDITDKLTPVVKSLIQGGIMDNYFFWLGREGHSSA